MDKINVFKFNFISKHLNPNLLSYVNLLIIDCPFKDSTSKMTFAATLLQGFSLSDANVCETSGIFERANQSRARNCHIVIVFGGGSYEPLLHGSSIKCLFLFRPHFMFLSKSLLSNKFHVI